MYELFPPRIDAVLGQQRQVHHHLVADLCHPQQRSSILFISGVWIDTILYQHYLIVPIFRRLREWTLIVCIPGARVDDILGQL